MNHENFETKNNKKQIIRPDRHEFVEIKSMLRFPSGTFEVLNYSAFGIAVTSEKEVEFSSDIEVIGVLVIDDVEVGNYPLTFVRTDKLPLGGYKLVFEIVNGSINAVKINTVIQMRQLLNSMAENQNTINQLPETFKRLTYEAKALLQSLEVKIQDLRDQRALDSLEEIQIFESTLIPMVGDFLSNFFQPAYKQLADSLNTTNSEELKTLYPKCVEFFRSQLKDLIYQSPFSNRSVSKPLGYAGDFEMMNIIYRNESAGRTLFGKCLHDYWMKHPEAKAVRNRAYFLNHKLKKLLKSKEGKVARTLSVACGPAKEIQMLLEDGNGLDFSRVEFNLLDQDLTALKYTNQKLKEIAKNKGINIKTNFINKAIKNIIVRGLDSDEFDLIYSAGLFDYFSDPVAKVAAKTLFNHVKTGGQLIIGNFNLTTPNQFTMRLALDWNLIYRSAEDLERLFGDIGGTLRIEQEPEGVNLFCVIEKKSE